MYIYCIRITEQYKTNTESYPDNQLNIPRDINDKQELIEFKLNINNRGLSTLKRKPFLSINYNKSEILLYKYYWNNTEMNINSNMTQNNEVILISEELLARNQTQLILKFEIQKDILKRNSGKFIRNIIELKYSIYPLIVPISKNMNQLEDTDYNKYDISYSPSYNEILYQKYIKRININLNEIEMKNKPNYNILYFILTIIIILGLFCAIRKCKGTKPKIQENERNITNLGMKSFDELRDILSS